MENLYKINIQLIADYMKKNNLSKDMFCKKCNINIKTLERILRNKNVRLVSFLKISKALNVKLQQMFI